MIDAKAFGQEISAMVRGHVAKALEPVQRENGDLRAENKALADRLAALEERPQPVEAKGASPDEIEALRTEVAVLSERLSGIKMPEAVHGKDGAGIVSTRLNDDGELICKLTTGETLNAGRVAGKDGLGFDDLSVEHDGERALVLRFQRGDEVKAFEVMLPIPIDRGVYKDDGDYLRGDAVTWAGSFWIAQKDAPQGKPEQSKDWRLAVKRGRDARVKP